MTRVPTTVMRQVLAVSALAALFACSNGGGGFKKEPPCASPMECSDIVMRNEQMCRQPSDGIPQQGKVLNTHPNRTVVVSGVEYRRPLNSVTPETDKPWVRIVGPGEEAVLGCQYRREVNADYLFQWVKTVACFQDDCTGTEMPLEPPPLLAKPRDGDCEKCNGPLCITVDPQFAAPGQRVVFNELQNIGDQLAASNGNRTVSVVALFSAIVAAGGDSCERSAIEIRNGQVLWNGSECVIRIATGLTGADVEEFRLSLPQSIQGSIQTNVVNRTAVMQFAQSDRAIRIEYFKGGKSIGGESISRMEFNQKFIRLTGATHYCLTIQRHQG